MFAIAFDLIVREVEQRHPKGVSQAYTQSASVLGHHGFERVQGSVYTCESENLANLFAAISALKAITWFPTSVRDICAFRVAQWSDFTATVKQP